MKGQQQFSKAAIGKRIRTARTARGISQRAFATQLGVDQSHLWKYEHGKRLARVPMLIQMSRTLRVSLDYLLRGIRANSGLPENIAES